MQALDRSTLRVSPGRSESASSRPGLLGAAGLASGQFVADVDRTIASAAKVVFFSPRRTGNLERGLPTRRCARLWKRITGLTRLDHDHRTAALPEDSHVRPRPQLELEQRSRHRHLRGVAATRTDTAITDRVNCRAASVGSRLPSCIGKGKSSRAARH